MHGNRNTAPTAAITGLTVNDLTVTFQDNSTDAPDKQYNLRITVNWGDGTIETGLAGSTFEHTYRTPGNKTIRQVATDTEGLKGNNKITVNLQ